MTFTRTILRESYSFQRDNYHHATNIPHKLHETESVTAVWITVVQATDVLQK